MVYAVECFSPVSFNVVTFHRPDWPFAVVAIVEDEEHPVCFYLIVPFAALQRPLLFISLPS